MDSQLAAWIAGIGAILFATMGVALSIREVRRKERRDAQRIIDELEDALLVSENEAVAWHAYVFQLRAIMADHGIVSPEPPPLAEHNVESSSLIPGSDDVRRSVGWFRRGRRRRRRHDDDDDLDTGTDGSTGTDG